MENLNCLRCRFRHEDNGNCTAIGGFCTAVPAAHCQLLREYLDTGLTPEKIERSKLEIEAGCVKAITRTYGIDINRLRKLAEVDKVLAFKEAEYIDRKVLKNDIATSTEPFNTGSVFRAINRQAAADVAPVVRCKDCKYHYDCGVHFCNRLGMDCPNDSDFFCSYGEKKDEKNS